MKELAIFKSKDELHWVKQNVLEAYFSLDFHNIISNTQNVVESAMDTTMDILYDYWIWILPPFLFPIDELRFQSYKKAWRTNCALSALYTFLYIKSLEGEDIDFSESVKQATPYDYQDRARIRKAIKKRIEKKGGAKRGKKSLDYINDLIEAEPRLYNSVSNPVLTKPFMEKYRANLYVPFYTNFSNVSEKCDIKDEGYNKLSKPKVDEGYNKLSKLKVAGSIPTCVDRLLYGQISNINESRTRKKNALRNYIDGLLALDEILVQSNTTNIENIVDKALAYYVNEQAFCVDKFLYFIIDISNTKDETEYIIAAAKLLGLVNIPLVIGANTICRDIGDGIPEPITNYVYLIYEVFIIVLYEMCGSDLEIAIAQLSNHIMYSADFNFVNRPLNKNNKYTDRKKNYNDWDRPLNNITTDIIEAAISKIMKTGNKDDNENGIGIIKYILNEIYSFQRYPDATRTPDIDLHPRSEAETKRLVTSGLFYRSQFGSNCDSIIVDTDNTSIKVQLEKNEKGNLKIASLESGYFNIPWKQVKLTQLSRLLDKGEPLK